MRSFLILFALCGSACVLAEQPPTATVSPLTDESKIDDVLDALDVRGKNLKSLSADVAKTESDMALGEDPETRSGRLRYEKLADDNVRILASFDKVQTGDKVKNERVEYLMKDGELVDRNYRSKVESRRVVQRPGEKIDLFKLGQGPFPLPIGQEKSAVHAEFEVTRIAAGKDDPANTIHLKLAPKDGTELSRKFKAIDVWVDKTDYLPRRIDTLNAQQSVLTSTKFTDVQLNTTLSDDDFKLEAIKDADWKITRE